MALTSKQRTLFQNIACALSTWTMVEIGLETVFGNIADIPNRRKAHAMFDAIISFETRLAIVNRLMTLEQVDEVEAEMWNRMAARLKKFYGKRHELAHFTLGRDNSGDPDVSPFTTLDKWMNRKTNHLSLDQVKERAQKFMELQQGLNWFAFCALERRLPKGHALPLEEPPLIAQLRELAIQNLAKQKPPPQS